MTIDQEVTDHVSSLQWELACGHYLTFPMDMLGAPCNAALAAHGSTGASKDSFPQRSVHLRAVPTQAKCPKCAKADIREELLSKVQKPNPATSTEDEYIAICRQVGVDEQVARQRYSDAHTHTVERLDPKKLQINSEVFAGAEYEARYVRLCRHVNVTELDAKQIIESSRYAQERSRASTTQN